MAYTKKTWQKGEVIKATDLNNMETGIEAVTDDVEANNVCFDRERQVVEFIKEGRGTSSAIDAVVLSSYSTQSGKNYDANVDGKLKIIIGNPIATTKSLQIAMAVQARVTDAVLTAYPWLSSYVDENNVMQTTITGLSSMAIGTTYSNGSYSFTAGSCNVSTGSINFNYGQLNKVAGNFTVAIGSGLIAETGAQVCIGRANDNKSEDLFEIGNGLADISTGDITRSNAFRVTFNGDAIAQNSIGIEDGNGGVVTITAAQLQALLALIPPQYEVKELTSSNRTYSMAAFDDISKLPTPTPYELQAQGYYLNTESTTIAGLRMEGGVSPAINGAILKVNGGSTVNFNPGALDISYAMCEFNANMNQPIGGASPSTWLTESTTLKDTTAYIGIHFKVNSGEMTEAIRNQLLSTISIVSE